MRTVPQFSMRNIKLTLQYDGSGYFGWQRQRNNRRTIQETIEKNLQKILCEKVTLIAAGRTDAGVHAVGQIANFKTRSVLPLGKIFQALNALLPEDIKVSRICQVPLDFHSRYSARSKTYRYTILNRSYSDVFTRRYTCFVPQEKLDVTAMQRAGSLLVGSHDFSSFKSSVDSRNRSNIRTIKALRIRKRGYGITIDITGDGFLHKMVRGIVGTLLEIGRKKLSVRSFATILKAKNRTAAGPTAPACGLCLVKVVY